MPIHPAAAGELRQGTRVGSAFAGIRVFANRSAGFAISDLPRGGDATYPLATTDGGRTWRTDGPALHLPAAQGPLVVDQAGLAGARIYFAWCATCNTVIDATPDAGAHWWRAFLPGNVLSVIGGANARDAVTAIVEGPTTAPSGRGASLWVYRSRTGQRWTYVRSMNAVS